MLENQNGAKKNQGRGPKLGSATHEESGLIFVNLDYKEKEICGVKVPGSDFHMLLRKENNDIDAWEKKSPFVVKPEEDVPDPRIKKMVDELRERGALFFSASPERRIVFRMAYRVPVYRYYYAGGIHFRSNAETPEK